MKTLLLAILALPLAGACFATTADLERIDVKVAELSDVLKDPLATREEVDDALDDLKDETHAVAVEAREREEALKQIAADAGVSSTQVGAIAAAVTGIAGVLMNFYRNQRGEALAKARKEEIKTEVKAEVKAGV
jgi:predicted transcriptional regulator